MDTRLEKALDFSNYMVTLNNQKRILQEQYCQDIIFYFNGGQFTVNQQLICFCHTMILKGQTGLVLVDDNNIPVSIVDANAFFDDILDVYFTASNKFLNEYNSLKINRSVEKLVDIHE